MTGGECSTSNPNQQFSQIPIESSHNVYWRQRQFLVVYFYKNKPWSCQRICSGIPDQWASCVCTKSGHFQRKVIKKTKMFPKFWVSWSFHETIHALRKVKSWQRRRGDGFFSLEFTEYFVTLRSLCWYCYSWDKIYVAYLLPFKPKERNWSNTCSLISNFGLPILLNRLTGGDSKSINSKISALSRRF